MPFPISATEDTYARIVLIRVHTLLYQLVQCHPPLHLHYPQHPHPHESRFQLSQTNLRRGGDWARNNPGLKTTSLSIWLPRGQDLNKIIVGEVVGCLAARPAAPRGEWQCCAETCLKRQGCRRVLYGCRGIRGQNGQIVVLCALHLCL